ncbi:DNA ligase 1-like [Crassostrea angulata]|uniref:DNA ligase 1-like n=1 Tax=Magallana angulata TaxID=2784310 RepID=UPI0022B137CC|nr:DNA ligase 1-like [Crassostrea angulata]
MSDTESSARNSDDSDEEVEEDEDEEEDDEEEEESEEVEEEDEEEEEDIDDENADSDTNGENDENDENDDSDDSDDSDHDKSDSESDSEKTSTESESDDDSDGDKKKMRGPAVKTKTKTQPEVISEKEETKELQQKNKSDDEQGSEEELKGLEQKIETEDSKKKTKIHPQHVEDKSVKIDSPVLKRKRDADDDFTSNSKRDEQKSNDTVEDLAAKTGNKENKEEIKIKAQHVESVREESLALQQKSHLPKDSNDNDNSKSDQQENGRKVIGDAPQMENKESEKETEINVQPVKSVRTVSPELQQKSHSAKGSKGNDTLKSDKQEMKDIAANTESKESKDSKGNDTFKSDKQEMKDIAAKTESKESKNKTKIIAAQPVEDKSLKKELSELQRISDSSDNYKSNKQVMEVKVPAAKTEINESKKETKINTQPVEAESVRKQSSDQANKALPTEKKEAKREDFSQTTGVPGTYVQVDRCDVISTRRVGTQTKLKHYNVCTFTSGLIKKVNMQTYTSGLISKSDHSTNTIQERRKDKKTQTKDKNVLERHLIVKDNDSSEKKTTDSKDTTKKSDENENETSVQLKRRKVKVPLLKLSPEEESNSANSTESTEDRPPQPDSLSKKAKDIKSIQKLQKTPIESSGVYTDKEYDKKTRKEKENIRRRGRRRPQLCNFSKRHPSREYIPKPSKNKTLHFRRPTSAGPVYKRELINPIHRPGDSKNKILLVRPNSAGPVHKRQSKQPEGTALSMAQYRMLYHHRWADISC